MAHLALKAMDWGTSTGQVRLEEGDELPEVENTSKKILDRLFRRKWITNEHGHDFNGRELRGNQRRAGPGRQPNTPAAKAKVDPPSADPGPPPLEPTTHTKASLGELDKEPLRDLAGDLGLSKRGTKAAIVTRILEAQREG